MSNINKSLPSLRVSVPRETGEPKGVKSLLQGLGERLLLDGAMGSMLMKGNNDALNLTDPDRIEHIHRLYLEAGADIITANTFSSNRISQKEYGLEDKVAEMNRAAVRIARKAGARFILGDVGPTSKMLSMSEDANDPAARSLTFDELESAYKEQISALLEEGVDGILIETAFDTLNVKAAISAYSQLTTHNSQLFISFTISDASGRTLSGQTIEAFVTSIAHARPYCIGMNCGLGAEAMLPYLRRLKAAIKAEGLDCLTSCHPNAGLPNQFGDYDQTPEDFAAQVRPMIEEGLVDIIGGCCGTTPSHIASLVNRGVRPLDLPGDSRLTTLDSRLNLSGLENFAFGTEDFITVGERCNVAGSRKFLRLINEKKYDEALDIALDQVKAGADVIDINMDDGLLDAEWEMGHFVRLIASDPSICRIPLMIDSSRFEVIEAGLKNFQGKCIVNSISLKQGEEVFLEHARTIKRLGAATIVMLFDEEGQATDYERRIKIAERAYRLLVDKADFDPCNIIFDPNILTIATGMEEHANYARDYIRAAEWITRNLPGVRISGGLSNLSFAFRGNNYIREAMHSVFLHHARQSGMNMAIMNPKTAMKYESIDGHLRDVIADVIYNRSSEATERLAEAAQEAPGNHGEVPGNHGEVPGNHREVPGNPKEVLGKCLLEGTDKGLTDALQQLLDKGETPLEIISGPLMEGMTTVGRLFGEGQMFLPQVVKTARTMKKATGFLEPYMTQPTESLRQSAPQGGLGGSLLIATVKGDVHDIGKNIVSVVLTCNGLDVTDLGVMVPPEKIVEEAIARKVDFVCLSGLITPSLEEMATVARMMEEAGLKMPLLVGGATTSAIHTAVKIAPLYSGGVFHMRAAADNAILCHKLMDTTLREKVIEDNNKEQERLRMVHHKNESRLEKQLISHDSEFTTQNWSKYKPVEPPFLGEERSCAIPVSELVPLIDWTYFYWAWRVKEGTEQARMLKADAMGVVQEFRSSGVQRLQAFYRVRGHHDRIDFGLTQVMCKPNHVCPEGDYAGVFAATVAPEFQEELERLKAEGKDDYRIILMQTLGDRLVEAASEYMSRELKEKYGWGGIRPAVGYPMIPDQKQIFNIGKLIDFSSIGITLTENGAMYPQSSVCGVYISNPDARY